MMRIGHNLAVLTEKGIVNEIQCAGRAAVGCFFIRSPQNGPGSSLCRHAHASETMHMQ